MIPMNIPKWIAKSARASTIHKDILNLGEAGSRRDGINYQGRVQQWVVKF